MGNTKLKPGNYKVEWQGAGPAVQVSFQQNGKTVVTVPGTLKTNDDQVTQDAIVTEATSADKPTLKEIRFGHQKEALGFDQNPWLVGGQFGGRSATAASLFFEVPGSCIREQELFRTQAERQSARTLNTRFAQRPPEREGRANAGKRC